MSNSNEQIQSMSTASAGGAARIRLDADAHARFLAAGVLVTDAQRSLPLPFDGRFFAASDWIREQAYFLRRQADFGRAVGAGVAAGLEVSPGASATTLDIQPGHGLTPAGELVLLDEPITVDVGDIAHMLSLSRALGLSGVPRHPARTRSGLFVLALRPVEFTANAVASYPKTLDGSRTLHHGDIMEGVVVTLVPFPDPGSVLEGDQRRGRVARAIFLDRGGDLDLPEALPLAMVALRRGVVDWVDTYLVRRELGTDREDVLGLGRGRRAARVAQVHQYHDQLDQILQEQGTSAPPFAAARYFDLLPPAGRLPLSAVDANTMTQQYFPIAMDVRMVAVPAAELPMLVEDALRLPPIDLSAPEAVHAQTTVFVLVPADAGFQELRDAMGNASVQSLAGSDSRLRASSSLRLALGGGSLSMALQSAGGNSLTTANELDPAQSRATLLWRQAVAGAGELWYVRARVQHTRSLEAAGSLPVTGDDFGSAQILSQQMTRIGLGKDYASFEAAADADARRLAVQLLCAPRFFASKLLMAGALHELLQQKARDRETVLQVAARYLDPALGNGLARVEAGAAELTTSSKARALGKSLVMPELDSLGVKLDATAAADLGRQLADMVDTSEPLQIKKLVLEKLEELER